MRALSLSSLGVSAAASALLLVSPFIAAGPTVRAPMERLGGNAAENLAAREIEAFAEAYVAVAAVHQRIAAESDRHLGNAKRLLAVKEAGEAEATEAIEAAGLTRERFQAILSVLASDDDLREQAIEQIELERDGARSSVTAADAAGRLTLPDA